MSCDKSMPPLLSPQDGLESIGTSTDENTSARIWFLLSPLIGTLK